MNYRNEYKIQINQADLYELRPRLKTILKPDPNARNGKYKIRSLYFDTPEDSALIEKLDGNNNREKFRLRSYNNDFNYIRLEKKSKVKGLPKKETTLLTKEEALNILKGDFSFIKDKDDPLLHDFYHKIKIKGLKPKSIVEYIREPYIYKAGNIRITIDSNIRTSALNPQNNINAFFDPDTPFLPIGENEILMEVKWDEFLPDIVKEAIQINSRFPAAFSKYALSRTYF